MTANAELALEHLGPLDPELQWIASESAVSFSQRALKQNLAVSPLRMAKAYCPAVADAVAERLGVTSSSYKLGAKEAASLGADALARLDPDYKLGFHARVELAARVVVAAAKLRFLVPVFPPDPSAQYWPFGQDGGFCNPRKLADS
jgi:hypothetical protein